MAQFGIIPNGRFSIVPAFPDMRFRLAKTRLIHCSRLRILQTVADSNSGRHEQLDGPRQCAGSSAISAIRSTFRLTNGPIADPRATGVSTAPPLGFSTYLANEGSQTRTVRSLLDNYVLVYAYVLFDFLMVGRSASRQRPDDLSFFLYLYLYLGAFRKRF